MEAQHLLDYAPVWEGGMRVRLSAQKHPRSGQSATILEPLPNPSKRQEHQWYDVRFDDGVYGRFLESTLEEISTDSKAKIA